MTVPTFYPIKTGVQNQFTYTACAIDNGYGSFYNGIQSIDIYPDIPGNPVNELTPNSYA